MYPNLKIPFFFVVIFSIQFARAEVVNLTNQRQPINLITYVEILKDSSNSLTIQDIKNMEHLFTPISGSVIGKAFDPDSFWIKLALFSNDSNQEWILECTNHLLDSLTIFQAPLQREPQQLSTGMLVPMVSRPIKGASLAFEINKFEGSNIIYLRSRSSTLSEVPLRLLTKETYQSSQVSKYIFFSIMIGVFILSAIHSFITYVVKRERIFLLLFLYTILSLLNNGHFSGLSFLWYPANITFLKWLVIPQVNITYIIVIAYSSTILNIKLYFPKIHQWLWVAYAISFLMLLSPLYMPWHLSVMIHSVVPQCTILLFGILGIVSHFKGNKNALIYSLGWLFHFGMLAPYILSNFGLLPSNTFTENSPSVGVLIEILCFSLASNRYFAQKIKARELRLLAQSKELNEVKGQIKNYLKNTKNSQPQELSLISNEALAKLSQREFDVLKHLMEGKSNNEIAEATFVSINTIKTHIKSIYSKMEVHNRVELVKKLVAA